MKRQRYICERTTWDKLMEMEKNAPQIPPDNLLNSFDENDITTIIATMELFNATEIWREQTKFDLMKGKYIANINNENVLMGKPRYRCFDWLAMCVDGRNDDDRKQNENALKVLVYSFLKVNGDEQAFIKDLRFSDYYVDHSWENVKIDSFFEYIEE